MEAEMTEKSIDTVRRKILQKTSPYPSFSTNRTVINVVTDQDHHPYTRWFRGVSYFPDPIIAEREAGWRPLRDSCYDLIIPSKPEEEQALCFEAPCTTTFPCIPEVSQKYADRKALDTAINKQCIVQYR
jgi:hypothetical protein